MVLAKRNKKRTDINELIDEAKEQETEEIPKLQEVLKHEIAELQAKKVRVI